MTPQESRVSGEIPVIPTSSAKGLEAWTAWAFSLGVQAAVTGQAPMVFTMLNLFHTLQKATAQ